MATAIGLAMQLSASTSGLSQGLTEADKLIGKLGRGAEQAAKYFDSFRDATTGELPAALQAVVDEAGFLADAFRGGAASSDEFREGIAGVSAQAADLTKAFQEGAQIAEKYRTEDEKRAATIERLGQLLQKGAVSQETYDRAMADATGATSEAAKAEKARTDALSRAAQITAKVITPQEKYDKEVLELQQHLDAGRISQETYNRAVGAAAKEYAKAVVAGDKLSQTTEQTSLKLNELSGIVSVLPGPLGSVAGRISGLASAGEGLKKLFDGGGGLTGGLDSLSNSLLKSVNGFTLGVAGAAAFGAAAVAIGKGLVNLEDRVEKLGNEASKLGASFTFIQTLETAAERSGSSIDSLSGTFSKFLKGLDAAKSGQKTATEAFAKIGLSAADLEDQSPEALFTTLAERITAIEDPAQRAAAAMGIFGKSGADLLPVFKNIAASEQDLTRYLARLSEIDKVRLDNFGSSLDSLSTATRGLGQAILLPFTGLADGITKGAAEFLGGVTAIVKPVGQILEPLFSQIGRLIEGFLAGIGAIGRTIGAVLAPFGEVFEGISAAVAPAYDAVLGFFTTVQDGAVAAVEAIMEFSAIGIIADNIDAITAALEPFVTSFVEGLEYVYEVVGRVGTIIYEVFQQVYDVIAENLGGAVEVVGSSMAAILDPFGIAQTVIPAALSAIGQAFGTLWDTIGGIISGIGGFIEQVLTFAEDWLGITRQIAETPIEAEIQLDTTEPALAATQFYDEITKAVEATKDLGAEGFDAAVRYQTALEDLAQLAAEGELSEEELKKAVANTTAEFERSVDALESAKKARDDAAKAAEDAANKQIEADRKVADQLIETARIDSEFGGNKERLEATENLLVLEREIARVEAAAAAARQANDQEALQAATQRLAALDQALTATQETAEFGFNQADIDKAAEDVRDKLSDTITLENMRLAPEATAQLESEIQRLEAQLEAKIIDPEQFKEASEEARKFYDAQVKQAQKVADLQLKYEEEYGKLQDERLSELAKKSQEALKVDDIRTSAGASELIRIATGREDPAVEEYRKQLKKLDEIKKEIAKTRQQPVEIA